MAETALVPTIPTPMELLDRAVAQNLDIDKLAKLLELQEKWELTQARKAFVQAMNEFKKNPPTIIKNAQANTGSYTYNYATLDRVCSAIIEGLSKHGISHRWETGQADTQISVTCILTHEHGHSEQTTLKASPDTSGGKNSIQAIGSTVSYLERYTLLAAAGLAVSGMDSDGKPQAQLEDLNERLEFIANCCDVEELKKVWTAAMNAAKAIKDTRAMNSLAAAKNKRYREIVGEA